MTILLGSLPDGAPRVVRSREALRHGYYLLTPDNHFPGGLPHLEGVVVRRLTTPRAGAAKFGEYRFDLAPGGGTTRPLGTDFEYFAYVLTGEVAVTVGEERAVLVAGGYAFAPQGYAVKLRNVGGDEARLLLVKRRYEPWEGVDAPPPLLARAEDARSIPTSTQGITRHELLPNEDPAYDFNMSLIGFEPGVPFSKVEVHDEEHGLYMTQGNGVYLLDGESHEVTADDYIYMAPYCPQYYYGIGPGRSEYLLYKDMWRDGF